MMERLAPTPAESLASARREGFLRTTRYLPASPLLSDWWAECRRKNRPFILLIEKQTCSRLIFDANAMRRPVFMKPLLERAIEDAARQGCIGGGRSNWIIGPAALDIDRLYRDTAEEMAEILSAAY